MTKKINWLFLVAGTFIMMYIMSSTARPLNTTATPYGILNLELAYNNAKTQHILKAWAPGGSNGIDNIRVAIKNTWLDFIFLFFYSLFLFYTCKTIAESFKGFINKIGLFVSMGALYAGLMDIAENAGMLFTLNGLSSGYISLFTTICSVMKWLLVLSALLYFFSLGPFALYKKLN